MRDLDDLVAAFNRGMPARVAEATELWLRFEQGTVESLAVLRRLLHTVKGEAHMLEQGTCAELAEVAESVVDALRKAGEVTPLAGDALLGAFEAMGMVTSPDPTEEAPDLEPVFSQLRAAIEELESTEAALEGRPMVRTVPPVAARDSRQPSVSPDRPVTDVLSAEDVRPLVHEMRRLYGEQAVLHERLRESQRMLRALLVEIDPRRGVQGLEERVTKTLGYGIEVDRRINTIRAEWSSNDFAVGLTLDELDNVVRRASVVSTDRLLNQVLRIGRSTGRTLGKEIDLEVHGDAILDATVAQRLEPALLHLVRNAIDHGIEPVDVRRRHDKPQRGQVKVTIGQTESSVTVEVTDDGGGVNFDRLRTVLASRVDHVDKLSTDDLLPYLFEQGVSTSELVTKISGRGVGLDVVAREVAGAGGQTRIESKPAVGTKVLLHLPTTLRGELVVPVTTGGQLYALPTRSVYSVVRVQRIERTDDGVWIRLAKGSRQELCGGCRGGGG
jgi:two-component system chemotaxis sensor kinase CheA